MKFDYILSLFIFLGILFCLIMTIIVIIIHYNLYFKSNKEIRKKEKEKEEKEKEKKEYYGLFK